MGGDLNLKKSWHPHLRKNQERVWKEEKSALEERKQIEKLRKEREEERQIEELQKLQEQAGGRVVQRKVDWMYAGPNGDGTGLSEEREGYLLGKRRVDDLLKDKDTQKLQKGAAVGVDAASSSALDMPRDTQKKVLQDPLLMIQKQKMEMQLKAMKNAQKEAKYEEKRAKEKERERKHRDKGRDRERSRDRDRKHHSRRERSRSHDRDDRDKREHRHRRHERDDRDDRESHRRRSKSRSRSPYRKSHRDERRRSRSPRRRDDREERDSYRRRDRTPPRRSFDKPRRSSEEERSHRPRRSPPVEKQEPKESVAERLAKMQAAASSLEEQRAERVRDQDVKDAEEDAKVRANMDGRKFIAGVRGQASNMDLGDAIARSRNGARAEIDV